MTSAAVAAAGEAAVVRPAAGQTGAVPAAAVFAAPGAALPGPGPGPVPGPEPEPELVLEHSPEGQPAIMNNVRSVLSGKS